ncbi:sensor histidine kinase [Flavihumibacter profundi]|uniref:sensor histidine kinase n=1 Tax=Flavihumibacter profundi TaxID=2716883 RepID=UPI001CC37EA7|nr:HAMP domain-containing sensor histidine kinase [Flavihumibacter profundi]MBZ5858448.1 HAMP domain-containing histidine kinase [Flavihumibacter profundi]
MRSSTTRILILLLAITIAAIIGLQIHWLQKTYAFEKNVFNTSVIKSIRGLYEDMDLTHEPGSHLSSLIEHPNPNIFLFKIDSIPQKDSLAYYLKNEFEDFDVYTDCRVAVYNYSRQGFIYESVITATAPGKKFTGMAQLVPVKKDFSYVYLFFPNRNRYIITQMNAWILTSSLLLLLLIGFSFAIYYLYQQKFLNEVQKDFINNVTHEFSTPLMVIDLSTDALTKQSVLQQPEKIAKYANSIRHQSDYLKSHIKNLINTVVADQYTFAIKKTAVIPNELIRQAVLQLDPIVMDKKGVIELNLEENNKVIQADNENLYLALFNIINNALKYATQPHVIINTYSHNSHYYISIKDNGIGIDAVELKKIFKKFYRGQKGNLHNSKGLGLGLYFTKKIISLHHGNIHVNSIPGIGTDFTIELPVNNI